MLPLISRFPDSLIPFTEDKNRDELPVKRHHAYIFEGKA